MLKKILSLVVMTLMFSVVVQAAPEYSIKTMTPEVQAALSARKDRFDELRALKASGAIGENNHGYVEVLNSAPDARSVADRENRDRAVIYQTIAKQNGLENALSTIEFAFAQVRKDKAVSGEKIQEADGSWTTK
jgi:uncharacterized protein YdbL (DUF1318 family)